MPDTSKPTGLSGFDVLSIGIKLIGLYLSLGAIKSLPSAIATISMSYSGEFVAMANYPHPSYEIRVLGVAVLKIVIAGVLVFCGDRIARLLTSGSVLVSSPREGLCVAVRLIGIYFIAVGIPYILSYLVSAFSIGVSVETTRFGQSLNLANICRYCLPTVIGIYLITGARHFLDLVYGRLPQVEEANEAL
ncbi:MAG: hypothetical protein NT018_06395 [Armatimonadetes bacterium]|nr:hypothetical protein [Armatimonadota bacterium]